MDTASSRTSTSQRISGPAELLQAVPYLLGFHPARSLVLVGLHADRLAVTARLDLADALVPGVVAHAIGAMARGGVSSIVAAVYDDTAPRGDGAPPWFELADLVADDAASADCELVDALLVSRGRWWSLMCAAPECCPPEGQELPAEPTAFAAAATVDGVVALPGRADLEAMLDPLPDAERAALKPAIAAVAPERRVERALFTVAREADEPGWPGVTEPDLPRFGAALTTIAVRDALWTAVDDRRIDGRPLWLDLARRLPAPYDAPPLLLFGWAAWRAGNGALAGIAAHRAVESDPGYRAADLLRAAVAAGADPRQVPTLRPRSA